MLSGEHCVFKGAPQLEQSTNYHIMAFDLAVRDAPPHVERADSNLTDERRASGTANRCGERLPSGLDSTTAGPASSRLHH